MTKSKTVLFFFCLKTKLYTARRTVFNRLDEQEAQSG